MADKQNWSACDLGNVQQGEGGVMFGLFESTLKAAASVVTVPVSIAADVVTLGGALTDKGQPYTADALSDLMQNVKDMAKPRAD